jgi:hypothetical protein
LPGTLTRRCGRRAPPLSPALFVVEGIRAGNVVRRAPWRSVLSRHGSLSSVDLGNINLGNIDVGNIDVGNFDVGNFDAGNIERRGEHVVFTVVHR